MSNLPSSPHPSDAPFQREVLMDALRQVQDPELGENIVDLGLVELLDITPDAVRLTLIPTSTTCPMSDLLLDDARQTLQAVLPPKCSLSVDMDWQQTWTPERLSPALQQHFGWSSTSP